MNDYDNPLDDWMTDFYYFACRDKIFNRQHIVIFFLIFPRKHFDISLETICMKCQILFCWKNNKKNIITLSSAVLAQRLVMVICL